MMGKLMTGWIGDGVNWGLGDLVTGYIDDWMDW